MGWIRCVRCVKLQCDIMARTFVLIALVQYILQQVSCSDETIPNAPKYYETDRNISLGSNGVDWVRCCEKSWRDFLARTFALIAQVRPVLHRVSCSYKTIPNAPKHNETLKKMCLGSNGVDQVRWLRKITTQLCGMNFCINCTNTARFAPCFMQ